MRKKKGIGLCVTVFLFLVWLLPGCAPKRLYQGAERPESEIAILNNPLSSACLIIKIDDTDFLWPPSIVHLPPGKHTIFTQVNSTEVHQYGGYDGKGYLEPHIHFLPPIEYIFKAGHVYKLHHDLRVWIADITEQEK